MPASKQVGWVLTRLLDMFETSSSLRWLGGGCLRSRALSGKASAIKEATLMFARSMNSSTSLLASLCTAEEQKIFWNLQSTSRCEHFPAKGQMPSQQCPPREDISDQRCHAHVCQEHTLVHQLIGLPMHCRGLARYQRRAGWIKDRRVKELDARRNALSTA